MEKKCTKTTAQPHPYVTNVYMQWTWSAVNESHVEYEEKCCCLVLTMHTMASWLFCKHKSTDTANSQQPTANKRIFDFSICFAILCYAHHIFVYATCAYAIFYPSNRLERVRASRARSLVLVFAWRAATLFPAPFILANVSFGVQF